MLYGATKPAKISVCQEILSMQKVPNALNQKYYSLIPQHYNLTL